MDNITTELLLDMLNMCKVSFEDGLMGSYILGDQLQKIFTVEPKYFSFTDYDIHIADNTDVTNEMIKIEQLTYELIKSGQVDLDVILSSITSDSLSDMKYQLVKSFQKRKEENNQIEQAGQTIKQYEDQIKQIQTEYQKAQNELEQIKQKSFDLENKKIEYDYEVRKEANNIKESTDKKKLKNDEKRIDAEVMQLYDENPYNNEIKNV